MDLPYLIDKCISGYGEMDIAIIVMTLYKDNLPKGKDLYIKLNNEVSRYFLERATYWNNNSVSCNSNMHDIYLYNSKKLSEISLKFKDTKFKKSIMEEIDYLTAN
jgi:hypothetical protein